MECVSRFPMPFRFLWTANEKDFSLSLEMTVWGKALAQGHGSPSFLWNEVPQRGGGWLTQRNENDGTVKRYYRTASFSHGEGFDTGTRLSLLPME